MKTQTQVQQLIRQIRSTGEITGALLADFIEELTFGETDLDEADLATVGEALEDVKAWAGIFLQAVSHDSQARDRRAARRTRR